MLLLLVIVVLVDVIVIVVLVVDVEMPLLTRLLFVPLSFYWWWWCGRLSCIASRGGAFTAHFPTPPAPPLSHAPLATHPRQEA